MSIWSSLRSAILLGATRFIVPLFMWPETVFSSLFYSADMTVYFFLTFSFLVGFAVVLVFIDDHNVLFSHKCKEGRLNVSSGFLRFLIWDYFLFEHVSRSSPKAKYAANYFVSYYFAKIFGCFSKSRLFSASYFLLLKSWENSAVWIFFYSLWSFVFELLFVSLSLLFLIGLISLTYVPLSTDVVAVLSSVSNVVTAFVSASLNLNLLLADGSSIFTTLVSGNDAGVFLQWSDLPTHFSWFWFNFGSGSVILSFKLNSFNLVMLWVVFIITIFVVLFSFEYMVGDPRRRVFIAHLLVFSSFMGVFVASDDLITAFIGWEGVGLSSFFLINFWFTRVQATKAAFKAILVNKVGDSAFLIAIALSFYLWKTVSFSLLWDAGLCFLTPDVNVSIFSWNVSISSVITFCLVIAAMTKSAQFGLHTWLPDAMEGPTPVSALIHAATMVTAGILLLIKCFPLLLIHPHLAFFVAVVGAITSVFAGTVACCQHDIKKIIAYSTCSQLGLMFMACGLGYPEFAFFHLITHAFFKALLFLSAGSVVHFVGGEQDIRKMGGLAHVMPYTNIAFFFGNLCIAGFPFYSGFYSKELLVLGSSQFSNFVFLICLVSTLLTAVYSCRLQWFVMWRPSAYMFVVPFSSSIIDFFQSAATVLIKIRHVSSSSSVECGSRVRFVLIGLMLLSISAGFIFNDYIQFSAYQSQAIWVKTAQLLYFETDLSLLTKLFPVVLVLVIFVLYFGQQWRYSHLMNTGASETGYSFRGWVNSYSFISCRAPLAVSMKYQLCFPKLNVFKNAIRYCYDAMSFAWYVNSIINSVCIQFVVLARYTYEFWDKGIVELGFGSSRAFRLLFVFLNLRFLVGGAVLQIYFFLFFVLACVMCLIFFFSGV